ncbi:hypothetical protein IU433_12395 [Nocardia puris]|uniref:hypothetical protein n=1 Tax=Nocardia puris TaxID=208602 RepID=UPI001894F741|nr:hypothetical protein [Nocardia puris]MBF6459837.1 hypothetical protein [Nocardia puris]
MIKIEMFQVHAAVDAAVAEYVNGAAPSLPRLPWILYQRRHLLAEADTLADAEAWVRALRLEPVDTAAPGVMRWKGRLTHGEVEIVFVADRAAHDAYLYGGDPQ